MRQRFFLLLSVAIIAAHWSWSFADWARSPPPIGNAGSIHDVGVFICMLTIVETPVLWGLLRGSGESFRSLGFGTRDIAVAFRSGRVLRGVGSLFVISIVVVPTIRAALARHADGGSTMLTVWGQEPVRALRWHAPHPHRPPLR